MSLLLTGFVFVCMCQCCLLCLLLKFDMVCYGFFSCGRFSCLGLIVQMLHVSAMLFVFAMVALIVYHMT